MSRLDSQKNRVQRIEAAGTQREELSLAERLSAARIKAGLSDADWLHRAERLAAEKPSPRAERLLRAVRRVFSSGVRAER
jgi:hypothetical protein